MSRFQMVMVDEPSPAESISILRGLKEKYENHHRVRIEDDALIAAVNLSHRYINNRFLPDKAIDLVDEACAMIKTDMNQLPADLDLMQRKITQLEIEETALKKETDQASAERLSELQKERGLTYLFISKVSKFYCYISKSLIHNSLLTINLFRLFLCNHLL